MYNKAKNKLRKMYLLWRLYSVSKSLQRRANYDGDLLLSQYYDELIKSEYPQEYPEEQK